MPALDPKRRKAASAGGIGECVVLGRANGAPLRRVLLRCCFIDFSPQQPVKVAGATLIHLRQVSMDPEHPVLLTCHELDSRTQSAKDCRLDSRQESRDFKRPVGLRNSLISSTVYFSPRAM